MKKRIRLNLTGVGDVLIDQEKEPIDTVPRCDNGLTMEQYEDLDIPYDKIPQELKDRKKALDNIEEEVEEVYSDIIVYEDQIKAVIEDDEGYTTIFLKDGLLLTVLESALDIDSYLDYVQLSWIEKQFLLFKSFFAELKWKLSKENKQLEKLNNN